MEICKALKYKVQMLIDSKMISFKVDSPNVNNNPRHAHASPSVNTIKEYVDHGLIKEVGEVETLLLIIR